MMTDTAIKNGIDLIDVFKEYFPNDKAIDTVSELVDIAKKYQKIETIIKMWKEDRKRFTLGDNGSKDEYLRQISEVLEDGNDD